MPVPGSNAEQLTATLISALGRDHVLTDPDQMASYLGDWTGRWRGQAALVVRPGSTAEVVAVVRACAAAGVAMVPQGGNTSLAGGSVPAGPGARPSPTLDSVPAGPGPPGRAGDLVPPDGGPLPVVVSLVRLGRLDPVDPVAAQVTVGAGVSLSVLQQHVATSGTGLAFGVDLAARDSATIGGMVATNAGGIHVVRYGGMRHQVAGLEVLRIINEPTAAALAYGLDDLPGLLTGSEGTLGIVTAICLRLVPAPATRVTALIGLADTFSAMELVTSLTRRMSSLEAAELFYQEGVDLVCRSTGLISPLAGPWGAYLLVECAGADESVIDELGQCLADYGLADDATAVAADRTGRDRLWALRERHTEVVNRLGVPHKFDISLPRAWLAPFVPAVADAVAASAPGATLVVWGHAGDGNLHVNVIGPAADDLSVDDAVFRLVAKMGGSISAEHGIGRAKVPWLHLTRSEADIGAMRAIKHALDPVGLFNPGVLLPPD